MTKEEAAEPVAWAVVPAEPTYEMATAFKISWGGAFGLTFPERYRAMIAAAPTVSAEDADDPSLWRFWNDKARDLAAEADRMRHALERLASPEAFIVSRSTTEEERARMFYAEAVLQNVEGPTAYAVRRALTAIGGRDDE